VTSRHDFTHEEWARLTRAPLLVGLAISLSDPGGPVELLKESNAAAQTVLQAAEGGEHGPLVQAVATDVAEQLRHRHNPLGGFQRQGADAIDAVLDELRAVNALLVDRATRDETVAFREWLRVAAQRAATAAKEGGFLGVGGTLVSDREQDMLEQLGAIFEAPPS
jgi:hypothetical protein